MTARVTIRPVDESGDLGWVVMSHSRIYFEEFGWDTTFEALVARIVADYAADHDPLGEAGWIAEVDGRPVGCVFCVARDAETAQLRLLLVDPAARGLGLGRDLVRNCLGFARAAGYRRIMLWTNDVLVAAARLYLAAGFELVEEEPHHSFGVDLVGQIYELDLKSSTGGELAVVPARPGTAPAIERGGTARGDAAKTPGTAQP